MAVWRPRVGAVIAVLALAVATTLGVPGYWDLLPLLLLGLVGVFHGGARRFWLLLPALAGYAVLVGLVDTTDSVGRVILVGFGALAVIITGLAARSFADVREDALSRLDDLAAERDRVPAEERRGAARELHDVVAHQLSLTTMLVMAAGPSEDPCRAGRHPGPGPPTDPGGAPRAGHPADGAPRSRRRAGRADAVGHAAGQRPRPRSRVLQESTTNLLRYAPAGSTCHVGLTADDAGVRLTVASPLATTPRTSDLSLGWGLRGLRERMDLSQGTFAAGPDGDGRWVVAVTLPAAAAPVNTGAYAART